MGEESRSMRGRATLAQPIKRAGSTPRSQTSELAMWAPLWTRDGARKVARAYVCFCTRGHACARVAPALWLSSDTARNGAYMRVYAFVACAPRLISASIYQLM